MEEFYQSEIHKLLKLGGSHQQKNVDEAPAGLPVAQDFAEPDNALVAVLPGIEQIGNETSTASSIKSFLIYPAIFLAAFVFFYVVLNLPSVLAQVSGVFAKSESSQILGGQSAEYYKWIGNYFYAVGNPSLLSPTNDIDKDGLTNYDEFIIRTNPILADSDNDGFSDGIEIINSTNPWGSGTMSKQQQQLANGLDLIMINNRISYNVSLNHAGLVAGANTSNYDLEKPGRLSIPKLKLSVALVWSKDPSDFDTDLTKGVIHYPGTAMPGENGIIYVSGHSSDYFWKKDPMHDIFAKLNFLSQGDDVFVDVYGKDGKVYNFHYKVTTSKTYKPDDQAQFIDSSNTSKINLSTCWPIGTSKDRLVVTAEQVAL